MNDKSNNTFWLGYSDLMTSLFFVMLVLFVLAYVRLSNILDATEQQLKQIKDINSAVEQLDRRYFEFDERNKRYKLKIDVKFKSSSSNIWDIPRGELKDLKNAGLELQKLFNDLSVSFPNVSYLLIIEGNTQRSFLTTIGKWNYQEMPDEGYRLSYKRALALVNYWKQEGIILSGIENCEILIAGSGYFGKNRSENELENRKFTIQITPRIGNLIDTYEAFEDSAKSEKPIKIEKQASIISQ